MQICWGLELTFILLWCSFIFLSFTGLSNQISFKKMPSWGNKENEYRVSVWKDGESPRDEL